ncbi:unnamed protein product [Heligmosomoides polygyrus]|uniref:G protein-coupled receptor n=1 Tax=Heligmosomoides polygyrus TaxID=6339 RepID=A0A3P8C881_HELPZ|nr:unnamed protein product [Heligmosomoides polygyrus]
MSTAFSWTCQVVSALSIIFNIYLLYIYFRCPLRMIRSYKYFFLLTAIQNLGFSITLLLLVPILISHDFSIMFLSTGPMQTQPESQVLMLLFCSTFITSLHLVADSFIYRYLQVCKPHFFLSHLKPRYVFVAVLLNMLILMNWVVIILVGFWPSSEFKSDFSDFFERATGLKSFDRAQLGFSMKTACPFALLHGPATFAYFLLFAGVTSSPAMSFVITTLMTFYPLFGPLIIVFFIKDYRNYTLSQLRCFSRKSASVPSVFVSEMRTNQVIVSDDCSSIFISVGPLRMQAAGQVLIMVFGLVFITSLLLITNSFIHRYLLVCQPRFFRTSPTPRILFIAVLFSTAVIADWCVMIVVALWPNEDLIRELSGMVARTTGLNSSECAQLGFSMKYSITPLTLSLIIEMGVSMLLIAIIIAYSALNINRTLKRSAFSRNLRRLHQQMFVLLLVQTACPFALLYAPCFVAYLQLFTGFSSNTATSYTITLLLSFFPFLVPFIIVFFLKDYRNYTLSVLRLSSGRNVAHATVAPEMRKTVQTVQ